MRVMQKGAMSYAQFEGLDPPLRSHKPGNAFTAGQHNPWICIIQIPKRRDLHQTVLVLFTMDLG